MPEPEDVPVDTGYADAYLANARAQSEQNEAAEGPGIGSKVLGGIGWTLGLLRRPVQTALHGLLTGNSREMGQAFDSILDDTKAKDFSDIRKDVLNIRPEADDKTWFGNGVGNFATKLGVGALDLAGDIATDPVSLVNPLNMTKAGAALRSVQEGAQAELLAGGKNILQKQAARQGMEVTEYAAKKEAEIFQKLKQNIDEDALKNSLTTEEHAVKLEKAKLDAAKYAQEVAPHMELASEINGQLGILNKQHGVNAKLVPEWKPGSGTLEEIQQSFDAYKGTLAHEVEEMFPKRWGDQVDQGYRKIVGVGNPIADGTGGYNLGLKNPGAVLNKVADLKDGVVQTMEATTLGRAVIDTKRWFADSIMNPAGRGSLAMVNRLSQSAKDTFLSKTAPEMNAVLQNMQKFGVTHENAGLVSELATVYGTKDPAQMARAEAIQKELFVGKTIDQQKAMAEVMERSKKVNVDSLAMQVAAGVEKDAIGERFLRVIDTVNNKIKSAERDLDKGDIARLEYNNAKRLLDVSEGNTAARHDVLRQQEVDALNVKNLEVSNHNIGVTGQQTLERQIGERQELADLAAKVESLRVERDGLAGAKKASQKMLDKSRSDARGAFMKAPLEGRAGPEGLHVSSSDAAHMAVIARHGEVDAAYKAAQAELKAAKEVTNSAIQATRHLANQYGDAAMFYRMGGVDVHEAVALGKNRIETAGMAVPHNASTVHGLKEGLTSAERGMLEDGLMESGKPLTGRGKWVKQAAVEADPHAFTMAGEAEARMQSDFQYFLDYGKTPYPSYRTPFAKMKTMLDEMTEHHRGSVSHAAAEHAMGKEAREALIRDASQGMGQIDTGLENAHYQVDLGGPRTERIEFGTSSNAAKKELAGPVVKTTSIPALSKKAKVKMPKVEFPKPEGMEHAKFMALDEFIEKSEGKIKNAEVSGPSAGSYAEVSVDPMMKQRYADVHAGFVRDQIVAGGSVPRSVLQSHAEFTPDFREGTRLWNRNETNWKRNMNRLEAGSTIDNWNTLKKNVVKAQRELEKYNDLPSRAKLEVLKAEAAIFEKSMKAMPNYILSAMSDDSARKLVAGKQIQLVQKHFGEIERMFTDLGRPLSHAEVNALVQGEPHVISALAAVAGERPEKGFKTRELFQKNAKGQMPVQHLFGLFMPGENDYKMLSELTVGGKKITVEQAKAMPFAERVKYYQQAYGKFFEERLEVALALGLDEGAKAVQNSTFVNGVKELFTRPIPFRPLDEAAKAEKAQILTKYREFMKTASTADEKAALRNMRKEWMKKYDQTAFMPGYVDAELIHPSLSGRMIKRDVFDKVIQNMEAMKDPVWMKGMFQYMAAASNWWKALQLGVPGAGLRDWLGNIMLRFQNDGFHSQSFKDIGSLIKTMASGGDMEKMKDIVFNFPGNGVDQLGVGKMTAYDFYNHILTQGISGHGKAREVMEESMKGLVERGHIENVAKRVRDKWLSILNTPQEFERVSMFHSRLMKGDSIAAAAAATDAALYNYARVSPFVAFTRKTGLIPFATWTSKNIPAQLELMVKHPGQFAALLHFKSAFEGQSTIDGVRQEDLPEYARDKWNLVTSKDPETGDIYFHTLTGLVPMADLSSVESPAKFFVDSMGPLKGGFESLTNVNLFTRKEMERFDGELTPLLKDAPDSFLISKRWANVWHSAIGRPLNIANDVAGVYNDSPDRRGQPRTVWDNANLLSAGIGIAPKVYKGTQQMFDKKRETEDINRDIGVADKAMRQAQSRGSERAAATYQAQLYKLQEERAKMMSRR